MTQINDNKYSFQTRWIENEEKHCATLSCNGEKLETRKFDSHPQMMEWISDTMASMQLCGENWQFSYKPNCILIDRQKQLDSLKSELITDLLEIMNRYGLKEWKFSEDFSKHTDLHTLDAGCSCAALCWINNLYVAENGKLNGMVEFECEKAYVEDQDFFYSLPVEGLIIVKQHLTTEVRAYRTKLIKNWLEKVGANTGIKSLDRTYTINGNKADGIYLGDDGEVVIDFANENKAKRFGHILLRDMSDADFDKFNQYLDTQMKTKFEIRVSQVASRTIEVEADNYDQAVAMAKAEVERNPINDEDVDSIQFN
jgi:hypothetical protein